jgi:hypothetical protein
VRGLGLAGINDVCWSAAESDTVTGPA